MKKDVAFTLIYFAVLKWDHCLSAQVPFELPVQLLLELQANWLDQNVNELELNYQECRWNNPKIPFFVQKSKVFEDKNKQNLKTI